MTDTPPTAADELRAAAETLRSLATIAQDDLDNADYWAGYDKATAWRDGFVNGFGGVSSDLVAVFTPMTATALADWLDYEADLASRLPGSVLRSRNHHALAVARAVLGATDRSGR